jgi:hypothetical protein
VGTGERRTAPARTVPAPAFAASASEIVAPSGAGSIFAPASGRGMIVALGGAAGPFAAESFAALPVAALLLAARPAAALPVGALLVAALAGPPPSVGVTVRAPEDSAFGGTGRATPRWPARGSSGRDELATHNPRRHRAMPAPEGETGRLHDRVAGGDQCICDGRGLPPKKHLTRQS